MTQYEVLFSVVVKVIVLNLFLLMESAFQDDLCVCVCVCVCMCVCACVCVFVRAHALPCLIAFNTVRRTSSGIVAHGFNLVND